MRFWKICYLRKSSPYMKCTHTHTHFLFCSLSTENHMDVMESQDIAFFQPNYLPKKAILLRTWHLFYVRKAKSVTKYWLLITNTMWYISIKWNERKKNEIQLSINLILTKMQMYPSTNWWMAQCEWVAAVLEKWQLNIIHWVSV